MTPTTEAGRAHAQEYAVALISRPNGGGLTWNEAENTAILIVAAIEADAAAAERERPVYAALMALYEAVGGAPAMTETPRQRKVLDAWRAAHALLADPVEPEPSE